MSAGSDDTVRSVDDSSAAHCRSAAVTSSGCGMVSVSVLAFMMPAFSRAMSVSVLPSTSIWS